MLRELNIKNFAIIEQIDIKLEPGLVTFTGETGAGKSIIIDAVETLLGGRAEATVVRTGAEQALIEAVFHIPETSRSAIHAILEREALLDEPDYVTLGREIRVAGRNIARVNGRIVNTSLLRELGEFLIDVHGQSEHLSLLRVHQDLCLLDRFAMTGSDGSIQAFLNAYQATYKRLQVVMRELTELHQAEREASRQIDMLNYQVREIEAARLHSGEEDELSKERNRLANAENLTSMAQEALVVLDEGSPESSSTIDLFGQVVEALDRLSRLDATQSVRHEESKSLFEHLGELASNLRTYSESIEFNPKRLDQVEERLALINSLKRKYGDSIAEILEFFKNAQHQLDQITHAAERISELEAEQTRILESLGQKGLAVSNKRQAAASNLEREIEAELDELSMTGARFKVEFRRQSDPQGAPLPNGERVAFHASGLEQIEFLIAPNPGEGLKPLAKIASGGETSRLMLALKNVLAQADHIPTLIFDEIDQGIGGRIGTIVGHKLRRLGKDHQVLCVTHLPQLAVYGNQHMHVTKHIQGDRTITRIKPLQGHDRQTELAQMLGGVSPGTMQSAQELLQIAEKQTEVL